VPKADIAIHPHQFARVMPHNRISVREDVLFSNHKGEEKSGIRKRNLKTLEKLRPALERVLLPEETVFYIARARTPLNTLEQVTAGWWTYVLAAASVVVTNKRILFFPVKTDGSWKESVRSAQWGDLSEVKIRGWITPGMIFQYRNGTKEIYSGFRSGEAKKISAIAAAMVVSGAGEQSAAQAAVQLCPDCRSVLTPRVYSCAGCGLVFKNEKSMIWRSIFLPAGGYFYTGHPVIAILPALVEAYFLVAVAMLIIQGAASGRGRGDLVAVMVFLGFIWAVETAVTILHCRRYIREYIPEKRRAAGTNVSLTAKAGA
jgi:hypothetical protein